MQQHHHCHHLCKDYLKNISAVSMQQHHQVQQQWSQIIFTRPKKNYSTQKSFLFNIRDLLHMIQGYRILLKLVILYLGLRRAFHDIHLQNVFLIISNSSSPESLITLSKWLFKWKESKVCHKSLQLVKTQERIVLKHLPQDFDDLSNILHFDVKK